MMTGVDMIHVPYRGESLAITDLLGGQVQLLFGNLPASEEQIRSGRLRAIAVASPARSEALPDVPTIGEFVKGYEASGCMGLGAPTGTPSTIVDRLNAEINIALSIIPSMKARLTELGGTPIAGSPANFGKLIADETEKWAKVVKFSGAQA